MLKYSKATLREGVASRLLQSLVVILAALTTACSLPVNRQEQAAYGTQDFAAVRKIDTHVHANSEDNAFIDQAQRDNFELLSINVDYPDFPAIDEQYRIALVLQKRAPERFHFAATFSMDGWGDPDWTARTNARISAAVASGARAVKIWKNVGMSYRDRDGRLVRIDDPGFDPVIRHIEKLGVPLIGHQGEPKNCWLPLAEMTTDNDRRYFREHPQYHMYLHPEMPSYEQQMAARDRFLRRTPSLRFVGAHMASLEWSVAELARFLDTYPNAMIDLAARLSQVQFQSAASYERVREFFIRYQDRIMYATDLTMAPDAAPAEFAAQAHARWMSDWIYLATGDSQYVDDLTRSIRGLQLPRSVIDKIYYGNARATFLRAPGPALTR